MKVLGAILLVLVVFELALGGGGRLVDIGWFSPRMWLFCAALLYVGVMIGVAQARVAWEFVCLLLCFGALLLFHSAVSMVKDVPLEDIFDDIKPQLYFPMLAFFSLTITGEREVQLVAKLIKVSALVLSIAYLAVLAMWHGGLFTFEEIQGALNPTGDPQKEFYFRGDATFFFKAILYVGVGLVFFLFQDGLRAKLFAALSILALLATLTRGLVAAFSLSIATWLFFFHRSRAAGAGLALMTVAVGLAALGVINELAPTAAESVRLRLADIQALANQWDLRTLLIGNGLGPNIGARGHIEMNYMELLFKQGVLGLAFWVVPLVYMSIHAAHLKTCGQRTLAAPYYVAALFVYFENLTNPFLTNPIGMSIVLLGMVALRVLAVGRHATDGRMSGSYAA